MWHGRQEGQWQSDVQVQLASHLADIAQQLGQMKKSGGASSRPRRIEADAMVGVGESQYPRLMQVLNYGTRAIVEYCNENSPKAEHLRDAWQMLRDDVFDDGRMKAVDFAKLWDIFLQHRDPAYDMVLSSVLMKGLNERMRADIQRKCKEGVNSGIQLIIILIDVCLATPRGTFGPNNF